MNRQVYGIQVYSILYSLQQVVVTSLQVYSLQQIVAIYKSLTNQWAITLLQLVCFSTNQRAITLLHCCPANQWAFLHCLHVQEKHVATLFGIYCTVVNGA